jgi:acyl-CoA thioesterase-1
MNVVSAIGVAILSAVTLVLGGRAAAAAEDGIVLYAFGDSLTSGYGLAQSEGFAPKLQAALRAKGYNVTVINGGVAGDTTATALARLKWSLPKHVDAAIVELGANDAFRGGSPADMRANLEAIIAALKQRGIPLMLAGMLAPPNLGTGYSTDFNASFKTLADKYGVLLYPFFLDGVATIDGLNQADHIHPNPAGVDIVVARILPTVEKLIGQVTASRASGPAPLAASGPAPGPATP